MPLKKLGSQFSKLFIQKSRFLQKLDPVFLDISTLILFGKSPDINLQPCLFFNLAVY